MMSYEEFDGFCATLPAATKVVQWGGAHVWKVGGKVFAIAGWSNGARPFITFKCSELAYQILKERPGVRPAPYLSPRSATWIQVFGKPGLGKDDLKAYLAESHRIVAARLTRAARAELGLTASSAERSGP